MKSTTLQHLLLTHFACTLYMCCTVPLAVVSNVRVVEVCPALRIEWSLPDPRLLGGPEEEVFYVVSYAPAGGIPTVEEFPYNSSVMVRGSFSSIMIWLA